MMAVRGQCSICRERFYTFGEVSALLCGHTFHQHCVLQWLDRYGKNCPSCRQSASERTLVRQLFFDAADEDASLADASESASLQRQVNELETRLEATQKNVISLNGQLSAEKKSSSEANAQISKLRHANKRLEEDRVALKTAVKAVRVDHQALDRLQKELAGLKERVKRAETLETFLYGSTETAQSLLAKAGSDEACLLIDMKKQYEKLKQENVETSAELRVSKQAVRTLRRDKAKWQRLVLELREEMKTRSSGDTPLDTDLRDVLAEESDLPTDAPPSETPLDRAQLVQSALRAARERRHDARSSPPPPFSLAAADQHVLSADSARADESSLTTAPLVYLPGGVRVGGSLESAGLKERQPSASHFDGFGGRRAAATARLLSPRRARRQPSKRKAACVANVRRISGYLVRGAVRSTLHRPPSTAASTSTPVDDIITLN